MKYELPEFDRKPNPWPDRLLIAGCFLIIGIAGAMLIGGMFGYCDFFYHK